MTHDFSLSEKVTVQDIGGFNTVGEADRTFYALLVNANHFLGYLKTI
jgi:hypothetical protein